MFDFDYELENEVLADNTGYPNDYVDQQEVTTYEALRDDDDDDNYV